MCCSVRTKTSGRPCQRIQPATSQNSALTPRPSSKTNRLCCSIAKQFFPHIITAGKSLNQVSSDAHRAVGQISSPVGYVWAELFMNTNIRGLRFNLNPVISALVKAPYTYLTSEGFLLMETKQKNLKPCATIISLRCLWRKMHFILVSQGVTVPVSSLKQLAWSFNESKQP